MSMGKGKVSIVLPILKEEKHLNNVCIYQVKEHQKALIIINPLFLSGLI